MVRLLLPGVAMYESVCEKSLSFYPKSNFLWHKLVSLENKNFWNKWQEKSESQNLPLAFLKLKKMQLLRLFEDHKNLKKNVNPARIGILSVNHTAYYIWIVINSFSARIFKNTMHSFAE